MGRGRSGAKKKAGGGGGAKTTPSGITYDEFMNMSEAERYDVMENIINNNNIVVPEYLDDSETSKVMYGLGLDGKPTVMSEDDLDKLSGEDLYRTVYDPSNPPPYAQDILDQIRYGDYTQMSGSGGSYHGRAIYFAEGDYSASAAYGAYSTNSTMMRAKVMPSAKIATEDRIYDDLFGDTKFMNKGFYEDDAPALWSISHGYDGWHDKYSGYTMIVNRGALATSKVNKDINGSSWKNAGMK